jgi:hypothetical protein
MAFCELQQERAIFAAAVDAECRRWTDETQIAYINCYESYAVWLVVVTLLSRCFSKLTEGQVVQERHSTELQVMQLH